MFANIANYSIGINYHAIKKHYLLTGHSAYSNKLLFTLNKYLDSFNKLRNACIL